MLISTIMTIFAASSGEAAIKQNLIHSCHRNICQFREAELLPKQPYETQFTITYSYQCIGRRINVGLELGTVGGQTTTIKFEPGSSHRKVVLTGTGSLRTKNFDPRRLEKSYLEPGCRIAVESVLTAPSPATQSLLVQLDQKVTDIRDNIDERSRAVIRTHGFFIDSLDDEASSYCLIANYDDPEFYSEDLLIDLKADFYRRFGKDYDSLDIQCPVQSTDLAEAVTQCLDDPTSTLICIIYTAFRKEQNWFAEQADELDRKFATLGDEASQAKIRETVSMLKRVLADTNQEL